MKIFFTGGKKAELGTALLNVLMSLRLTSQTSSALSVHLGRPNMAKEIAEFQPTGAFGCGPLGLMNAVQTACDAAKVPFQPEEFQDSTLGKLWGMPKKK